MKSRATIAVAAVIAAVWAGGMIAHYIFGVDTHSHPGSASPGAFGAIALALAYFLPTAVALVRQMHRTAGLFLLNLLLGWTVLGWIVALIWSFSGDPEPAGQNRSPLA